MQAAVPGLVAMLLTGATAPAFAEFVPIAQIRDPHAFKALGTLPSPGPIPVLGQGFDIIAGELRQECVKTNGSDHTIGQKGASQGDDEYINTVSDMQSYDKVSGQGLSLEVTYKLFSGGAKADWQQENAFNSVDQWARLYRMIKTRIDTRTDGVWDQSIVKIVNGGLANPKVSKSFAEKCGTHFISAIYYGNVADQTIHFVLEKTSHTAQAKKDFSAGLKGIFSAGYSDHQSETNLRTVSHYVGTRADLGLIAKSAPDPNKEGGIVTAAAFIHTNFGDQVADAEIDKSAIIGVDITPYWRAKSLTGTDVMLRWQDDVLALLKQRSATYMRLLSYLGDLNFAKSLEPTKERIEFYDETDDTLNAKLTTAGLIQRTFRAQAKKCYEGATANDEQKARDECGDALANTLITKDVDAVRPKTK